MATIQNDNANKNALQSLNDSFDTELHKNKKYKWYSPRIGNLVIPQVYDDSLSYYEAINKLQMLIHAEIARAITAENLLGVNLDKEIQRAKQAESDLNDALQAEIARAKAEEKRLDNKIDAETARAKLAEQTITDNLNKEIARAKAAEEALTNALNSEIDRAKAAEKANADAIAAETTRATNKENELDGKITAEKTARENADKTLDDKITKEVSDRQGADSALDNKITAEEDARKAADTTINQNITNVQNSVTSLAGKAVTDVAMTEENGTYTITQEKNGVTTNVGTIDVGANNPVVEVKDSVVENNEKGYDFHTIGETTNDGTENTVGQFYLAQKQITKIQYTRFAPIFSTIDQNGNTEEAQIYTNDVLLPSITPDFIGTVTITFRPTEEDIGTIIYGYYDVCHARIIRDTAPIDMPFRCLGTGSTSRPTTQVYSSRKLNGKLSTTIVYQITAVRFGNASITDVYQYDRPEITLSKNECIQMNIGNGNNLACLAYYGKTTFFYLDGNTQHDFDFTFVGTSYNAQGLVAYFRANSDIVISANTLRASGGTLNVLYTDVLHTSTVCRVTKGQPDFDYPKI